MNTRSFLLLPPFLEEGIKLPKKFGKGSSLKKKLWGKPKGAGRGNAKVTGKVEFFSF